MMCNMVGYNMEEFSAEYLLDVLGCEALEVDLPNNGFSDSTHIFFRIEGIYWPYGMGECNFSRRTS